MIPKYIAPFKITDPEADLDSYAARGIVLSRDVASTVLANLGIAVHDLESRPAEANLAAARELREIRAQINTALSNS